jgi:hypothetical protein
MPGPAFILVEAAGSAAAKANISNATISFPYSLKFSPSIFKTALL